MTTLPASEFRRVYMRQLRDALEVRLKMSPVESRKVATAIIQLFQHMIESGEEIDLGFMKISPKTTKPRSFSMNFSDSKSVVMQGETTKWLVKIHNSWLQKARPSWAKPVRKRKST